MKHSRFWMLVMLVAWVTAGPQSRADDPDPFDAPSPDVKGYVSDRAVTIMSGATRVEVFRIKRPPRQIKGGAPATAPATAPAEQMAGYEIVRKGKDQDKDFAARFAKVALDGKTYILAAAGCFDPGVAFRFWKDRQSVDVLICFHCGNILMVSTGTDDGTLISFHRVRGEPAFVKLAKQAFPDDKDIQKLPD